MAVSILYSWDMKKLVADQNIVQQEIRTTDQGSRLSILDSNNPNFFVELNKDAKQIRLIVNSKPIETITMDDHTRLQKVFDTLLNTVKQKITFWKVN